MTWSNSRALVETASQCEHCGVALSGKVGLDNKAIAVADRDKGFFQRVKEEAGVTDGPPDEMDAELARRTADWKKSRRRFPLSRR